MHENWGLSIYVLSSMTSMRGYEGLGGTIRDIDMHTVLSHSKEDDGVVTTPLSPASSMLQKLKIAARKQLKCCESNRGWRSK